VAQVAGSPGDARRGMRMAKEVDLERSLRELTKFSLH